MGKTPDRKRTIHSLGRDINANNDTPSSYEIPKYKCGKREA